MTKSIQGIIILIILFSASAFAQEGGGYTERAKQYVKKYAAYAIADQKASGVPAAITLGQGILETEAGISELVTEANNHFGIKCKNGWEGPTFLHTDDAKDECFKKYKCAEESYNDHSAHLHRNPRYGCLFTYSVTDYARWAHGLKKCGYATNPRYAQQLIKIIEDHRLQQYTYAALDSNYDGLNAEDGPVLVTTTTSTPQVTETTVVTQPLQPATTTTVITTTTTTTKTIKVEQQPVASTASTTPQASMNTVGRAPQQPQVAAMPNAGQEVAPMKETSKSGMIAVSGIADKTANVDNAPDSVVNNASEASPYLAEEPLGADTTDKIYMVNGLKAIRGRKEETLLGYAMKHKLRYAQLLEMNDLPDEPLEFDTWIYLEKKNPMGRNEKHIVRSGESLVQIAQEEGMQLRRLAALNMLNPYEIPAPGQVLNLQTQATTKPVVANYNAPKQLPKDDLEGKRVAAYKEPKQEVEYGMSFGAPQEEPMPTAVAKQQDTTHREIVKQPFMREDPPQPQMNKPTPAPDYTKQGDKRYQVKKGETAFSVAKRHNITVAQLLEWNHLDPQDLKAGQTLIIKQ